MKEILTIFKYVDGENDELFYSSTEPIKLYEYSFSSTRMGSSTISSTLLFPVCLDNLWSGKEYVLFRGARYFIKNTPSSTKDNTSVLYSHSLEFASETELQLSNVYFIDAVYSGSDVDDKVKTNSTKVIFFGTLAEFATRIEKAISYSGLSGYTVVIDEGVTTDTQQVSFEDRTIFEALQDSFDIYKVPFYFIGKAIHFGYTDNDISQPFKYGFNNELLSIKKNNANYKVITRITGTGGENNIPYYYPNNSPKGNIEAEALASNTAITQADIELVNAEKFSNKVDLGASVVYCHGVPAVQSWTVNGVPDSGGLHNVTIPRYGPVVEKYVFQLSILSAGIFKISFDMWIQYVGTVYPIGDLISRYELKNKATGDSFSLTPIDSDKSTEYFLTPWLTKGDYELEIDFTLRFQGHSEYTYSLTPNIDSDYGWAIIATDGTGKSVELNDIGIEIAKTPDVGDGFTQVSLGSMPTSTVLLPPLYRETSGAERFYNAENNTYIIPGTEDYYQFENEFSDSYPKEHIFSDDSIYPTINGITNAEGQEIGRFLDVAYDTNDSDETDEEGNYLHPYFFVKLPKFDGSWGFNLFDHAIESGEMEIVMTSGNCNGCHFVIGVDEDAQKNLVQVDESGNLLRDADGDVRCGRDGKPGETPQEQQNDTRNNEVWIALKKDIDTFGVIMPNAANNYRPSAADKFVIINILLPQAYIDKAEENLKDAIIEYMAENNSEKFDFSVSFSRIYLATHPEIAGLLDENARLRITYNGATYSFYVSQYTYKAVADESLPEIGVELSETITVNKGILQNTIDEIKGDISKINTNIDPVQSMRSYFLLKNQNDETSGIVRFIRGILLGSTSSSNDFGFSINDSGGFDGVLSKLTLYGGKESENIALNIVNGAVSGLRHTVKRITGDATLTSDDYIVLVSSESAATITLPENPQNGQIYRIYSTSEEGITIYGNGRPIYRTGSTVALTQSVISASSGLVDIFYSFSGGGWYLSAADTELFELVNIGTEESPLMAIRAKYGLFSNSFISARGSDPEAGSGGGGSGVDMESVWYALAQPTSEKINVSHLSANNVAQLLTAAGYKLTDTTYGLATDTVSGLIKTGYAENGKNYAVKLDTSGAAYVTVDWQDKFDTYFGVDGDGNIYVKDNRGFYGNSFVSARGSDPEAGSGGGGGGGIDMTSVWYALGQPTSEKINVSHIPELSISKITGLQGELDSKLSGITGDMVTEALGYTPYDASQIGSASVKYAASAGKVSQKLTVKNDGGSSSASAKTFDGSAAVTVTIPTTLPASDVYAWAKAATKPSYTWSEIGGKPTTLQGYGITDGVNAAEATGHLNASVSGHTLSIGVDSGYTIPTASQITLWDKICALFDVDTEGNVYVTGSKGFWSNSFISARGSDPGAGSGGGSGVDMESVWYALGQPTTEKINVSHIPALQQLSGTLTNAQLANSAITVAGLEVPLGSAVTTAQIASALTAAGYKLTDTTYTLSSFGITASASELNKLDGLATTATELGYVHGVTSNIQTQLNGKANTSALSAYLPLTGGTMTGLLNLKYSRAGLTMLDITNTAGGEVFYRMYSGSTYAGAFTTNHKSYGTAIFNAIAGQLYLGITNSGVPHFQGNTLLHSGNYTNYTVTKTGGGASGSWGISISGIANRAVYLTSTYTGSGGLQPPSYFNGMGLKVNMMNKPVAYCDVIVVNGYNGIGADVPYINAIGFQKTSGDHGEVYHARGDYGGSSWGTWYKFLDEYNYAGILDSRYVKKSGDTMTGTLKVSANAEPLAEFIRTNTSESYIAIGNSSGRRAALTYHPTYKASIYNYVGNDYMGLLDDGTPHVNGNKIWYSGNDGSGSGLNADLLDGYHAASLSRLLSYINSGTKAAAGWYRVFTASSDRTDALGVNIILHLARSFHYDNNEAYTFCISAVYNNQVNITQVSGHANVRLITKIRVVSVISGALYVDFYLSTTTNGNTYYVSGTGPGTFQEAAAVSTAGGNVTEFTTVNGCKSSGGFSAFGEAGRAIGFDGNTINLCAATGGWAMGIITVHNDRKTSFDHWVCGAYGGNGDNINYTFYGGTYASPAMVILPNKMVGIGRTDPWYTLDVNGTIRAGVGIWSNGYVSAKGQDTTSDARYKRDVAALPAQAALAVLMRLRPSTWAWKDDGRRGAGFVAQEVLGVLPEAVREVGDGEDRHLALNYQMLHAYEVCMLQTHETELERLRGRVKQLENEIKRIRYGS